MNENVKKLISRGANDQSGNVSVKPLVLKTIAIYSFTCKFTQLQWFYFQQIFSDFMSVWTQGKTVARTGYQPTAISKLSVYRLKIDAF